MTHWCLVVEDEGPLAEMICDNLQLDGYRTERVGDGRRAIERMGRGGVDLVILDVMLPGCDGFAVLQNMRERGDRTPVLVLSARSSDDDRIRGLELEADDYLTKPFNLRELLLRVAALLRRREPTAGGRDILRVGASAIDIRAHSVRTFDGRDEQLSDSEVRLLRLLAGRAGGVVGRREIAQHLFGPQTPPTARSLDNIVLNLRKLLEPDSRRPRYLLTVRGVGWRLVQEQGAD